MAETVMLQCPYCGHEFEDKSDPRCAGKVPYEIACMPYTRTRGERSEEDDQWSRIGSDFHANMNWEAIGILRVPNGDTSLDVSYQLAQCPSCECLFDAYLNWTPDRGFGDFWPHLFGRDESGSIKRYQGKTRFIGIVDRIERVVGSLSVAVIVLSLVLLVTSFAPRLFIALAESGGSPWRYFWEQGLVQIVTRVIGAIALSGLLWQLVAYARFMSSDTGYYDLLDVQKPEHVTHWLNFTLARLVGVQEHGRYAITQTSALAGIPAAIVLISVWLLAQLGLRFSKGVILLNVLLLVVFMVAGYLLGRFVKLRRSGTPVDRKVLIFPVTSEALKGVMIAGFLWGTVVVLQMLLASPGDWYWIIDAIFEVAFWAVIAYFIGLGVQFAFGTNIYVYFQMSRLPLKLHPLRRFHKMQPINQMINATTRVLLIILFMQLSLFLLESIPWQSLGLVAQSNVLGDTSWLFDWVNVGFILVFAGLGIASSRLFPIGAVIYFIMLLGVVPSLFTGLPQCNLSAGATACLEIQQGLQVIQIHVGNLVLSLLPSLVLQGLFLSIIVFFHMKRGVSLTQTLRQQAKDKLLNEYENHIIEMNEQLVKEGKTDPQSIEGLQQLVELRNYLLTVKVDESGFVRRVVDILSPLVFSIVLPTVMQYGLDILL